MVNVRPGQAIKHFTANDPVAKWTIGHVATAASPSAARTLLDKLVASAPFKIRGIQVDGGSEFMSVFEDHCRNNRLELVVLPPKRPDLNGCVERAQSSWRYEFYASYELPHRIDKLQPLVDAFPHRYDHHRPTKPLATSPQPSISTPSAQKPRRLIWAEPGQSLADARKKLEDWRKDYNEVRSRGAIGNKPRVPSSLAGAPSRRRD